MALTAVKFVWLVWSLIWLISAKFTVKAKFTESLLQRFQHLGPLLLAGILFFGFNFSTMPWQKLYQSDFYEFLGVALSIFGLLFAVWSRYHIGRYWSGLVTLKEGHKLIRTGPYALVRHPIYTGVITAMFGTAIVAGTLLGYSGMVGATLSFVFKFRREEAILLKEFGDEYRRYKEEVPALIPRSLWTKT